MFLRFWRAISFRGHIAWQIVAASTVIYLISLTFIQRDHSRSYVAIDAGLLITTVALYVALKGCEVFARWIWTTKARK